MPQQLVRYAKPTVDIMFKKVFGSVENKSCLISFLTGLLKLEILNLQILNSEPAIEGLTAKGVRMDVLAELKDKSKVNVEIQVTDRHDTQSRSLYYWSKLFSANLSRGGEYESLTPVISVFITSYKWFEQDDQYLHKFVLKEQTSNQPFLVDKNLLGLYFIELPKFQKNGPTSALDTLEKWILFFQTNNDSEMEELKMDDDLILAITELEIAKMNPVERRYYEARLAGIIDYDSGINNSRRLGLKQGKAEGKAEGEVRGKAETLARLAKKRFPNITPLTLQLIFKLNSQQLDEQVDLILDCKTQEEFENSVTHLKTNE